MVTLVNRAKVSTATTGTGTITLGSAESGYQTFADAGVVDADVVRYVIEDGTAWEIGLGTYTASGTTLSRTVLESSNADAAINLSGSAVVFVGAAAEDLAPEKVGTITGTTLDLTSGNVFSYTPTADTTFVFSNPPTTGTALGFTLGLTGLYISDGYDLANAEPPAYGRFSVAAQETVPTGIFFKPDGSKMYVIGSSGDDVNEYDLSTAWDVTSASYLQNFSVSAQDTSPQGIFFKPDGTKMYVIGSTGDAVYSYTLSTAWDVSAASFDFPTEGYFIVSTQEKSPTGIFFKPDGTKMYVLGSIGDDVNQYDLSTAWDITSASYLRNFSIAAQDTAPTGIFFKPDGTKMYVLGSIGDDVNEYDLSTAWDVSSASYLQNFSVATQETVPQGIFFKPDGSKMYVIGSSGDAVYSYTLSTAWDVTSASYLQNFSVAAQETSPTGVFFKPDGTKMYVIGTTGDDVNEYDLSTAWDVSSASYLQNFSVAAQETNPTGIFFKPDGTKMYVLGADGDAIWQYSTGLVGDATFTYPASVEWPSGTPPTAPGDGETDLLTFLTQDGGTTYYGRLIGDNFS